MGFEFKHTAPSVENQKSFERKSSLNVKRESGLPPKIGESRFSRKKREVVDPTRRKMLIGFLALGAATMIGKKAMTAAEEILSSLNANREKTANEDLQENIPTESDDENYVLQEDLTPEETAEIKNLLDYDGEIELNPEKQELLERSWRSKYTGHVLYERELEKAYCQMDKYKDELGAYFSQCGVPAEFIYLSIPESYSRSKAVSHKGAVGPYQFMKETAIENGLRVNMQIDERTDFLKSGKACAEFLSYLHRELGDWDLALYAYNGGFARRYARDARTKNENPSVAGFLKYMEAKTEAIRRETKNQKHIDYKVSKGDTLIGIAKKHSVDYDFFRQFNNIRDPRTLRFGQAVKIPLSNKNREMIYNKKVSGIVENINYAPKCNAVFRLINEKNLKKIGA